ncbi:EF hand family [Cryptosporidium xiaoi]|uniref:ubiquitinyl hydrolase 1 n=1 Tax=Cryptosporidium xiaoi TaxID=659607 RepID=A0AAV9XW53_9CRYT
MHPIWLKSDFLDLSIGNSWGVPSEILGCDGGSWFTISNSAKFYIKTLERLQSEYLSVIPNSKNYFGSNTVELENLRLCFNKIKNSLSYISEEFPWSRIKYMYEKAVLRKSGFDYKEFHRFIVDTLMKIKGLENGHSIVLPGLISIEDSKKPVFVLYVVSRNDEHGFNDGRMKGDALIRDNVKNYLSNSEFSKYYTFALVNVSGFGTEYHLCKNSHIYNNNTDGNPTCILRDSVIVVSDIVSERLLHSSFWISLYRLAFASSTGNIHYLYTVLLPFLNGKGLYDNWCENSKFSEDYTLNSDLSSSVAVSSSGNNPIYKMGNIWIQNPKRKDLGSSNKLVQSVLQLLFQSYSCNIFKYLGPGFKASQFKLFLNWSLLRILEDDFNTCIATSDYISFVNASTVISTFLKSFSDEISSFSFQLSFIESSGMESDNSDKRISSDIVNSIPFKEWYEHLINFKCSFERTFPSSIFGFGLGSCTISQTLVSCPIKILGIHSSFSNFGQFRLDGPNVMLLAGDSTEPNVEIPVEFDSIYREIKSIEDVIIVLEACISACVLLSNQASITKNSYLIRFKLIQHIFQYIIPIPFPWSHPRKSELCFWSVSIPKIYRSQQVRLLDLLCNVSKHFMACSFSINFNNKIPQYDRLITMGSICCISDNICRCSTFEFKSPLSNHLTGSHLGPKIWFYTDFLNFQEITDLGIYLDPATVSTRSMILDYFYSIKHFKLSDNSSVMPIFSFEDKPGVIDEGTIQLLMHILTDYGFPNYSTHMKDDHGKKNKNYSIPYYYTGENKDLVDIIPEFYYIRDIFFYFKFLVTLNQDSCPDSSVPWTPHHASLSWTYNQNKDLVTVRAFDKNLECNFFNSKGNENKQHKGLWSSFTGWLTNSNEKSYIKSFNKLTDPNTIVNSFDMLGVSSDFTFSHSSSTFSYNSGLGIGSGNSDNSFNDGFSSNSSNSVVNITDESDVLYIRTLPNLSDSLLQSEVECLIQYLTTPYMRIPLILQFFADENRINSLSSVSVQHIIWVSLFEPWVWSPPRKENNKTENLDISAEFKKALLVPIEDRNQISTTTGLLFNELLNSPNTIFKSLEDIMLIALDKDTGSFSGANSRIVLFVLRISVIISNYTKYLIDYYEHWSQVFSENVSINGTNKDLRKNSEIPFGGSKVNGFCRGFESLFTDSDKIEFLKLSYKRLRYVIENFYLKMIIDWMYKALKEINISALCVMYAHIACIYGYAQTVSELNAYSISLLISSLLFLNTHYSVDDVSCASGGVHNKRSSNMGQGSSQGNMISSSSGNSVNSNNNVIGNNSNTNNSNNSNNNSSNSIGLVSGNSSFNIGNGIGVNSNSNNSTGFTNVNSTLYITNPWGYTVNNVLGVPDLEIFSIQARTRQLVIEWLSNNVKEANMVLDSVVDAIAIKSIGIIDTHKIENENLRPTTREWIQLPSISGGGRFVPLNEIPPDLYDWLNCEDFRSTVEKTNGKMGGGSFFGRGTKNKNSYKFYNWWRLKRFSKTQQSKGSTSIGNCSSSGVVQADYSLQEIPAHLKYQSSRIEYNEWFKTVLSINTETEINIQFSLFSLKNNNMRVLGNWIHDFEDFKAVISDSDNCLDKEGSISRKNGIYESRIDHRYQSADIANTQNLYWCKLIGSRIDLYRWEPFHKTNKIIFKTVYNKDNLPKEAEWIRDLFEPWRALFLNSVSTIYIEDGKGNYSFPDKGMGGKNLDGAFKRRIYNPPDLSNIVRMQFLYPLYEPGEGPESPNFKGNLTRTDRRFSGDDSGQVQLESQNVEIVTHSLKEIVVHRFPPVIMVYDIVEQGRIYYKQLCHTSNVSYSLGSFENKFIIPFLNTKDENLTSDSFGFRNTEFNSDKMPTSSRHGNSGAGNGICTSNFDSNANGRFTLASGSPLKRGRKPSQSLVIMRDYYKDPIGTEMYVPPRFLLGLIPQVFLETHIFWQSQVTGNIRGYPKNNQNAATKINNSGDFANERKIVHDSTSYIKKSERDDDLYIIDILIFGTSEPIDKYGLISDGISIIQRRNIINPSNVQTLINAQTLYGESKEMRLLFETLQRLEDMSHILLWSNDSYNKIQGDNNCGNEFDMGEENLCKDLRLDLIEFPRLHLTFARKEKDKNNSMLTVPNNITSSKIISGTTRYVCEQHSGLYISWRNIYDYPLTCELLRGLPHSILLENDDGDFFILVPATVKPIIIFPMFSNYNNKNMIDNSGNDEESDFSRSCSKDQGFLNKLSSLNIDQLSSIVSNTSLISDNIESLTTSPGQFVSTMASTLTKNLFYTSISSIGNTTKSFVESTVKRAGEALISGGSTVFLDGSSSNVNEQRKKECSGLYSLLYKGSYVLDRGDRVWHSQLGPTKHYLYPVHTSKSFLFINSVVSGLYLMLWRFLEQQFESVLSILDIATSSDIENPGAYNIGKENLNGYFNKGKISPFYNEWNSEERQLWQVFGILGDAWDCHPDAHACRLKMWLYCVRHLSSSIGGCGGGSGIRAGGKKNTNDLYNSQYKDIDLNFKWNIKSDIENYVNKFSRVSANCRLSVEEELEILQSFPNFIKDNPDLNNRLNLITAVFEKQKQVGTDNKTHDKMEMIEFQVFNPQIPQIDDFDSWTDITCLGGSVGMDVKNINSPISTLWENLSNTLGTLNMPPIIQEKNSNKNKHNNSGDKNVLNKGPEFILNSFIQQGNAVIEYESLISGEYATEFVLKFLNRSSITKYISNAISSTVSNLSVSSGLVGVSDKKGSGGGFTDSEFISSIGDQKTRADLSGGLFGEFGGVGAGSGITPVYLSDWIFIYELLTGQFPLQIIPGESSHIWGVLFTRSLPVWDWKSPNILVSILRLLILNPNISLSTRMPGFDELKKQSKLNMGTVLKFQDSFQSTIRVITDILKEEYYRGNVLINTRKDSYRNNKLSSLEDSSNSISSFFSMFSFLKQNDGNNGVNKAFTISPLCRISRWCVSLNRGDYNCNERHISCISLPDCNISKRDLYCYSSSPIFIVENIDKYLTQVDNINNTSVRGGKSRVGVDLEDRIYDLPGKLFSHPISKTTIGRSSLERYRNDIKEYVDKVKKKKEFSILGLDYEKLLFAFEKYTNYNVEEKKASGYLTWEEIRQGVLDLRTMLLQLFYKDGRFIDIAIEKINEIANNQYKSFKYNDKLFRDNKDKLLFWSNSFGKLFGKEPILHFDYLVSQLMNSSSNNDIKKLSLFMNDRDIEIIHSLTAASIMTVNRRSQVSMALIQFRDIISYISKIQDDYRLMFFGRKDVEKNNLRSKWVERSLVSLEMKLRNVARVLSFERHYMKLVNRETGIEINGNGGINSFELLDDKNVIAVYDPRFLVFEFAYSILLRKDQVNLIHKLYDSAVNGKSICHQMIMGAGKTTVISPLLSLLLGDSNRLVIQIVPHALLEFTRNVLRSRFSCIVKKRILKFHFNRNSVCTPELYKKFVHAKEQKAIILCQPTSIKSLFLKTIFLFRILRYWNNDITAFSGLKMALRYIKNTTGINKSKLSGLFDKNNSLKSLFSWSGTNVNNGISQTRNRKGRMKEMGKKLNSLLNNEEKEELYLQYKKELDLCLRILHIFKNESVIIVDEIDMILHPLKSELHWPIGDKYPLDLTSFSLFNNNSYDVPEAITSANNANGFSISSSENIHGVRWLVPWYLIEALLTKKNELYLLSNDQVKKSGSMINLILRIQRKIEAGVLNRRLQNNPHLVILDVGYYEREIKPLLVRWILFILRLYNFSGLSDEYCEIYINLRGNLRNILETNFTESENDNNCGGSVRDKLIFAFDNLDDYSIKMLNITMYWVNDYLPHIFQLVHRVSYGLLDEVNSGVERANWFGYRPVSVDNNNTFYTENNPPISRHLLSIPFIGKDTPSVASEFSHPDIVIGLSILSYRYSGLRKNDVYYLLDSLKRSCDTGFGQLKNCPSVIEFNKWVKLSGGRVRGTKRNELKNIITSLYNSSEIRCEEDRGVAVNLLDYDNIDMRTIGSAILPDKNKRENINFRDNNKEKTLIEQTNLLWPLDVLNINDDEQLTRVYMLLKYQPLAIRGYLDNLVFPALMEYSNKQISASGQEIGGDMLFSVRIGFSGTPSDLLPVELGKCEYEKGSDGEMINYLTNGSIVSSIELLDIDWTVEEFLLSICRNRDIEEDIHALIDTGAFITGYTNEQVAEFLLRNGLKDIDAIVFIDERGKQMIMLRDGYRIVEISQCGISLERRFAFYDHVHSIGQDIKHTPLAKAVLTISKDMVFRDFAQGAYRMRQLGQGQTIKLVLQAQVADLIEKNALACNMIKDEILFTKNVGDSRGADVRSEHKVEKFESDLLYLKSNFEILDTLLFLRCLCGWLLIQSITREFEQNKLLCMQSLNNIWRKKSFSKMINEYTQWEDCNNINTGDDDNYSGNKDKIVEIFLEKLTYDLPSTAPFGMSLKDHLKSKISENREIMEISDSSKIKFSEECRGSNDNLYSGFNELNTVNDILNQVEEMSLYRAPHTRELNFDREMEKELEMEMEMEIYQEREQEQEKQEEKQQEKQQENEQGTQNNKWVKPSLNISRGLWPFEYLINSGVYHEISELGAGLDSEKNGNGLELKDTDSNLCNKKRVDDFGPFAFFSTSKLGGNNNGSGTINRRNTKSFDSIEKVFLPLSNYSLPGNSSMYLDFPNNFMFTTNLYNPSMIKSIGGSGNSSSANIGSFDFKQRLNNISVIIEWESHSCNENGKNEENNSSKNRLPGDYLLQLKEAFSVFDGGSTGYISLDDLSDLLKTLNWVENPLELEREVIKRLSTVNNVEKDVKFSSNLNLNKDVCGLKDNTEDSMCEDNEKVTTVNNLLIMDGDGSEKKEPKLNNDVIEFIDDHPWENSSGNISFDIKFGRKEEVMEEHKERNMDDIGNLNNIEYMNDGVNVNILLRNEVGKGDRIRANLTNAITFEELYEALNSALDTKSNKNYLAVTLEEAQSIRWLMHMVSSNTYFGEMVRSQMNLSFNNDFSIKVFHLCSSLVLLDEINRNALKRIIKDKQYNVMDNSFYNNNIKINSDNCTSLDNKKTLVSSGMNILELQAQSIYKFVNSENSFTKQEVSTAVRILQGSSCKLRKEYYYGLKRCRRRTKTPFDKEGIVKNNNENGNLMIMFTTPNESAVLQCRGLASRLMTRLEKYNMTIYDFFKYLDKNHTGYISSVCLYAYLESLQIAPNPLDYSRIIRFIFNNEREFSSGGMLINGTGIGLGVGLSEPLCNISISQENFIRVFGSLDMNECGLSLGGENDEKGFTKVVLTEEILNKGSGSESIMTKKRDQVNNVTGKVKDLREFIPVVNESELAQAKLKLSSSSTTQAVCYESYGFGYSLNDNTGIKYFDRSFISKVKCKLVNHSSFQKALEIPSIITVWIPEQLEGKYRGVMKRNKERISFGYYGGESLIYGNRNNGYLSFSSSSGSSVNNVQEVTNVFQAQVLELTDNSSSSISESTELKKFINIVFPNPKKYKPIFKGSLYIQGLNAETELFTIWKPIPPTKQFVSIGVVITKGNDLPSLGSVRCVPASWCKIINYKTLPCIGHLSHKPIFKNESSSFVIGDNFSGKNVSGFGKTNINPVTFCITSVFQLLGVVVNHQSPGSKKNSINGSFVQKEEFIEANKYITMTPLNNLDEKTTLNYLNYDNLSEENILFSRLFWFDLQFTDIIFNYNDYNNNKETNTVIIHNYHVVPNISFNKRNQNSIGFFGI